jgi:hypothetical protein
MLTRKRWQNARTNFVSVSASKKSWAKMTTRKAAGQSGSLVHQGLRQVKDASRHVFKAAITERRKMMTIKVMTKAGWN